MGLIISPTRLSGEWSRGWALDLHTRSSKHLPDDSFDTDRTPTGEALFQLKYRDQLWQAIPLAETAAGFLTVHRLSTSIDVLIPVPPSVDRPVQPVFEVAKLVGSIIQVPVLYSCVNKLKQTCPMKNIDVAQDHGNALKGAFGVEERSLAGRRVLLFDDLYGSGSTLTEVAKVVREQGGASVVWVLTLTKKRTSG